MSQVPEQLVVMLFSENINLFNQDSRTQQTDRHDYYDNTALCTIEHRAVKVTTMEKTYTENKTVETVS